MQQVLEGIYHNGIIELKEKVNLKENETLTFLILKGANDSNPNEDFLDFGSYHLGKDLDTINIRDLAYDD
jgi:predicted DNA-binding antitoxin AbrB/MazE fold protein